MAKTKPQAKVERRSQTTGRDRAVDGKFTIIQCGEPYIRRLEIERGRGGSWRVRLNRNGKEFAKGFFDSIYDGKLPAFKAAKAWRNETETFRSLPPVSKAQAVARKRTNNIL